MKKTQKTQISKQEEYLNGYVLENKERKIKNSREPDIKTRRKEHKWVAKIAIRSTKQEPQERVREKKSRHY